MKYLFKKLMNLSLGRLIIMGSNESKKQKVVNTIDNIYAMFQQSNSVVLLAFQESSPTLTLSRIKNIENVVEQLLEPFKQNQKYVWGGQIYCKFKKHFTQDFEALWTAGRQQFYELLLINCKINSKDLRTKQTELGTYQESFYSIAAQQLELQMADTFIGEHQNFVKKNLQTLSVIGQQIEFDNKYDSKFPGTIPFEIQEEKQQQQQNETNGKQNQKQVKVKEFESLRLRKVQNCSLVLPQTLFPNRMSVSSQQEVYDLLKFYKQFSISLQQIFYSNNLISCPIKNFIFCLEEKISRKKIRSTKSLQEPLQEKQIVFSEEYRKISRIRQSNTNHLLYQVRSFLNAYTEFVWMFLQLHLMEEYTLSKIIQAEILYGIIFKNIWTFIDWIAERGFEFEEAQLEKKMKKQSENNSLKISSKAIDFYISLIDELRGEKHPQQYLKKVVVFYRQVSKQCQNADELLSIYEQVMRQAIKQKGGRSLSLFRMKNVVEKLLNIQDSSFSGGEITYSWTTWCILIQLLRQKVNYKYGSLVISKKMSEELDFKNSEIVVDNSKEQVAKFKKTIQQSKKNHISKS